MWIQIPFLTRDYYLDTQNCEHPAEGPSRSEMESLQEANDYEERARPLEFRTAEGHTWRLRLEGIKKHPVVPDCWWLKCIREDESGWEVYVIWAPESTHLSYICDFNNTIELRA